MKRHSVTVWSETNKNNHQVIIDNSSNGDIKHTHRNTLDENLSKNPGELMATAHAGSFSLKLGTNLSEAGFNLEMLETTCNIVFNNGTIIKSELTLTAKVDTIDEETFQNIVYNTLDTCPISKALNIPIDLEAHLQKTTQPVNRLNGD